MTYSLKRVNGSEFDQIFKVLRDEGYRVVGPHLHNQAIIYDQIESAEDLPRGWSDEQNNGHYRLKRRNDDAYFGYNVGPHSWKKFLFIPQEKLWEARKTSSGIEILPQELESQKTAFIGVRACELKAIEIQDKVFIGGKEKNTSYQARRENVFLIAVNCTQAASTCFCSSMNTGPKVAGGYDLVVTEIIDENSHYFLCGSVTTQGAAVLSKVHGSQATDDEVDVGEKEIEKAAASMGRELDTTGIKDLLYQSLNHKRWDELASRCLSCANCTMVCPTCFCSNVEDTTDLTGEHAERWRRWDSCFILDHSYIHGGNVHASVKSRYRQWMTHKLASWIDQFGVSGCVGCGRCITWCPVGIDLTEETAAIRMNSTGGRE